MNNNKIYTLALSLITAATLSGGVIVGATTAIDGSVFSGSKSCRSCHERFYELWATSFHGLAMQPYTKEFASKSLSSHNEAIVIGKMKYQAIIDEKLGQIIQTGPDGQEKYPIEEVLGGKNVYYFLTSLDKGRLQVLPLAYDVRKRQWFDTAGSAVRHFTHTTDSPLDWRDRPYTFNSSCFSCHVSQLSTNYNLADDSYHTTWSEPGINCETCHGSGAEHIEVCKNAPQGVPPDDLKLIVTRNFTTAQTNAMCGPCHAKMRPVSASFMPGDRYWDHYDLTTLENADFYPDGRDLGENYTYTSWLMSECVKSGRLSCSHCHTSSGRFRFDAEPNNACLPCHQEKVGNIAKHSQHPEKTKIKCIDCHMPQTEFARMVRSDHSMRPPVPAATIKYKSPNACNICHEDKSAVWADESVRKRRRPDYQQATLTQAALIDAARKGKWVKLDEMLEYISSKDRDEIFATSLIRLLEYCPQESKWPIIRKGLTDSSPLVRAAAATGLNNNISPETRDGLVKCLTDDYRLVRIQAAFSLSRYPRNLFNETELAVLKKASDEFELSLKCRLDDPLSHYNLGNYYQNLGQHKQALAEYQISTRLQPDNILPLVNASLVYAKNSQIDKAKEALLKAAVIDPNNVETNFNLGLLLAEMGDRQGAKKHLTRALKSNPNLPKTAYNLAVIAAPDDINQAINWCRKASRQRPEDPKYGYSLAYYLYENKEFTEAENELQTLIDLHPNYQPAYQLMGAIKRR